jgi:aminoglycoside 3-N-acetyltransferase I
VSAAAIRRLEAADVAGLRALNAVFAAAFDDPALYDDAPPSDAYLRDLLADPHFIALVAEREGTREGTVVGGLTAYVLRKPERARAEVYIYDLAVLEAHRRAGVATSLIEALKPIAKARGAWVIFVQADYVDPPAIALYEKLGAREEVLHFDIAVE